MRIAKVKTENSPTEVLIAITSADKPEISDELQKKWQKVLDLAAKIIGVPSGLITKLHEDKLEVYLTSKTDNNIFEQNLKLDLGLGWYCENVAGTRSELVISNANKDDKWKENNPSIPFNMISYMGIPILWPDGEIFGTFCMLDSKEHQYSDIYKELLVSLREIIQNDLQSILKNTQMENDLVIKDSQLREVHHRVKNHFNLILSTIYLESIKDQDDNSLKNVLSDIQSRISAISIIHDKLYHSMNLEKVILGDYLAEVAKHIIQNLSQREIEFSHNNSSINTDTKHSVPCGLLLNELVTNSLKYAFHDTPSPKINLEVKPGYNNDIIINYCDNGKGIPDSYDINGSLSLGMLLIKQSVAQLGGIYEITNDNGMQFTMSFKISD